MPLSSPGLFGAGLAATVVFFAGLLAALGALLLGGLLAALVVAVFFGAAFAAVGTPVGAWVGKRAAFGYARAFCVTDLATATRWPRYAAHGAAAGIRSVLAFRLMADERTLGALNLFSSTPDAFDDLDREIGLIVASHAAVAYRWARTDEQLHAAIESRQCIGEAIGLLVERFKITPVDAFAYLSRTSQDTTPSCAPSPNSWCTPALPEVAAGNGAG